MKLDSINAAEFRVFLHKYIYSDQKNINLLMNYISKNFCLFNSTYDVTNNKIDLKIKKTNIKKSPNYSHTANFYYPLLNKSFHLFFTDNEIFNEIAEKIHLNAEDNMKDNFRSILKNIITGSENITMLYNATAILDNSIVLYL